MSLSTKARAWAGFSVRGRRGRERGSERESKEGSALSQQPAARSTSVSQKRIRLRFSEIISKRCVLQIVSDTWLLWLHQWERGFLRSFLMKLRPSAVKTCPAGRSYWRQVFTTLKRSSVRPFFSSPSTSPPSSSIRARPMEPVPLPSHNEKQKATNWTIEERALQSQTHLVPEVLWPKHLAHICRVDIDYSLSKTLH